MRIASVLFLLTAGMAAGCAQDNEEELTVCNADPASIQYAADITPVLSANGCYGCHSGSGASGGINLEGHANLKKVADNGRLVGAVTHAQGFSAMPKGSTKISDCEISKIQAWVAAGAPNN